MTVKTKFGIGLRMDFPIWNEERRKRWLRDQKVISQYKAENCP